MAAQPGRCPEDDRSELRDELSQRAPLAGQSFERLREAAVSLVGQLDVDDASVVRRRLTADEPDLRGPVHELCDGALRKVEPPAELGDRRALGAVLRTLDEEQEQVALRCQPSLASSVLRLANELAQRDAERRGTPDLDTALPLQGRRVSPCDTRDTRAILESRFGNPSLRGTSLYAGCRALPRGLL